MYGLFCCPGPYCVYSRLLFIWAGLRFPGGRLDRQIRLVCTWCCLARLCTSGQDAASSARLPSSFLFLPSRRKNSMPASPQSAYVTAWLAHLAPSCESGNFLPEQYPFLHFGRPPPPAPTARHASTMVVDACCSGGNTVTVAAATDPDIPTRPASPQRPHGPHDLTAAAIRRHRERRRRGQSGRGC
jgi:hypothetical protein